MKINKVDKVAKTLPSKSTKCVTRLVFNKLGGIGYCALLNHSFDKTNTCIKCGLVVDGIEYMMKLQRSPITIGEFDKEESPFKIGDMVYKDGLFRKEIKIVNRIGKTPDGWIMLVDEHKRNTDDHIVHYCKVVSTKGWYKI